ncbi:M61 family metallopeptidase [Agitococcus lubricus]|uniref:Putative metalloprotease with PDZ domain n=1 Tax=Agitococcus lubricus TaxID=1077255 RepID=A0A2T5IX18_9GAMM|nr:PDZ domain-containing protein [Agitococcus lubricus]PTQ88491.1 putative metalloprotease with PDZ domain [Agitococcus lubricus]
MKPIACHYTVSANHPSNHFFQIRLIITKPNPLGQILWLPNWILGSYMIRDFARHIVSVSAQTTQGLLLDVKKLTKNQWQVEAHAGELVIDYRVYAWDLSVRGAHLDQTHGYFNGTCLLLAAEGLEQEGHLLSLVKPMNVGDWQVATSLEPVHINKQGFGDYYADDYLTLVDHPVEMADFTSLDFRSANTPHRLVITGKHRTDMQRLAQDLQAICQTVIAFWGDDVPPFKQYLFQVMAVGNGYGGLEHRSSTSLLCSRDDLPLVTEPKDKLSDKYKTFLGLCSHEYFHSWLVKRIQPDVLVTPNLHQENYTELLWVFEGFTSYYDDLLLLRAGVIQPAEYLELLAQTITRHLKTLGRHHQSVTESSFDAWTKYYKQDENTPNSVVSYYVKGALVALCIDLKLRQLSHNTASLDHVMRLLWQQYGKTGIGVTNDTVQQLCQQCVSEDLSAFWQHCLYSTQELPFAELLARQGIELELKYDNQKTQASASLGVRGQAAEGGYQLQHVYLGGAADSAGLSAGDVIIAIDGLKVSAQCEKHIATYAIGDTLSVHYFRRDELMSCQVQLKASIADVCSLRAKSTTQDSLLQQQWLFGQ